MAVGGRQQAGVAGVAGRWQRDQAVGVAVRCETPDRGVGADDGAGVAARGGAGHHDHGLVEARARRDRCISLDAAGVEAALRIRRCSRRGDATIVIR